MFRFFVILASVFLLIRMSTELAPTELDELGAGVSEDCRCCPGGDLEGDCCDWDFGACCATGMVAALPYAQIQLADEHTSVLPESCAFMPVHLLRLRDNGPPPTPPPIG
jgi:hypothetical protein